MHVFGEIMRVGAYADEIHVDGECVGLFGDVVGIAGGDVELQ